MKGLKNVAESAEWLRISPWTVRSYIKQGKLRPVRIGRRVLLEQEELQRFVNASKVQPITSEGSEKAFVPPEGYTRIEPDEVQKLIAAGRAK